MLQLKINTIFFILGVLMNILTDSHAHLTCEELIPENNIKTLIQNAQDAGVKKILNICTSPDSLKRGARLQNENDFIYNAAAATPHDVEKYQEEFLELVTQYASEKKLVAIGETGLDYYYKNSSIELQKKYFKKYLTVAQRYQLPVIIHCREAFDDMYKILDDHYQGTAILHCFTGSIKEAQKALERNMYISFSGIVTFKNSVALRKVAAQVPLEKMLIETDSPYLAPQKFRGQSNQPAYIVETAQQIADIKGVSLDEVAKITSENFNSIIKGV